MKLEINGKTIDGKVVVSGKSIFYYLTTKGLPLEFMLMQLNQDKYAIDWLELVSICTNHGRKINNTLLMIEQGLLDVYGPTSYTHGIINKLNNIER